VTCAIVTSALTSESEIRSGWSLPSRSGRMQLSGDRASVETQVNAAKRKGAARTRGTNRSLRCQRYLGHQPTFHIDSAFPYNPVGSFFHWLLNMTSAGGYPPC
jgi:hypothetical protein